jgi:uncharacterized protein DUF4241
LPKAAGHHLLLSLLPMGLPVSNEYLALAFADGRKLTDPDYGELTLFQHAIGDLILPTGQLVACDPFVAPVSVPFNLRVPTGRLPVVLTIADFGHDQRVAFASIHFQNALPVEWKMMATGSNDPATLAPSRHFGYAVDSGTGCFMDHSAGQALFAKMKADPDYYKFMIAEMEKTYRHTWDWLNLPVGDANVIAFHSGLGDGIYATYAGLNADEQFAAVVTEFAVVPE